MYRWYREAKQCYAYLSDVNPNEDPDELRSSFRQSR